MMRFNTYQAAEWLGGVAVGPMVEFTGLTRDSRKFLQASSMQPCLGPGSMDMTLQSKRWNVARLRFWFSASYHSLVLKSLCPMYSLRWVH